MRPWKRLSEVRLINDRWLSLRADRCALPNGAMVDPYYVLEEKEWVHVFALDDRDRLLLVRQYRYAADTVCLELPGGAVNEGEDVLAGAIRELREETGYVARHWQKAGALFANPARQTNRIHTFVARGLVREGAQHLDESEDIDVLFADVIEVQGAIFAGEFSQSLHVASFFLGCHAAFGIGKTNQT